MEFLIAVVALAIAGYIGYEYYKVKTSLNREPTVLELVKEVKVEVEAVEAKAEVIVPKVKKAAKKVKNEVVEEVKAKVTKKKPTLKVEK